VVLAAVLSVFACPPANAQDPARTATIIVHGFENAGATLHGAFGVDVTEALLDSIAALAGLPVARGEPALPSNVAAMLHYYGDTPPAYYTPADVAELGQVTSQWGGGVPRYALILAKYAREVMRRSGAQQVNFVSASFGSEITRWLIEKDVGGLASGGRIARWLSIEGLLGGNWAASQNKLVNLVDVLDVLSIDVDQMHYAWVDTYLHSPRTQADNPLYAGILIGEMVSTDDVTYENGLLTDYMRTAGQWQPNDGLQAAADAVFQDVTPRSRLLGLPPLFGVFHTDHFGPKHLRGAWAEAATFLTQRRRVTVRMTSATIPDLHEPQSLFWDWRPAEILLESRVYSPAVESRWGIRDPLCVREKDGAAAPLRLYSHNGETQAFSSIVYDDLVLAEETQLRLDLRAEEIDYDWRYGVLETIQQPYYDDLGSGTIMVSTSAPGTYTFQGPAWKCTLAVSATDYPFAEPALSAPPAEPMASRLLLRVTPNPHVGPARVRLEGLAPADSPTPATLEIHDIAGRLMRHLEGDAREGFVWDGRSDAGTTLPAGVYLYRLATANGEWRGRSVLIP
jgi:hypothetical protein